MMLFLYGPSAIGKTTFLKSVRQCLASLTSSRLVVVYADHCEEHHGDVVVKEKSKWGGTRGEKKPAFHLDNMVGDDSTMWVVDCMRYLNGLWPELIDSHKLSGGGLRIIVPHYTGEVGLYFRRQRCIKRDKPISDYWTIDTCVSESTYRVRSCDKHLVPVGIPCEFIDIDKDRKNWEHVLACIGSWLMEPVEEWYSDTQQS